MHTFRTLDRQIGMVPGSMARALGGIDMRHGRERALQQQHPEALKTLTAIARIQSTEASNAIERITAPRQRIADLAAAKTTPANRSEAEIAGYRAALDTIHASARDIPFTPGVVEQLHRDLYRFTNVPAGRWKSVDDTIEEEQPDGSRTIRFQPISAAATPDAMQELHAAFAKASQSPAYHPLLLIGCYVFDFLAVHPFRDGNGRMARLLTLLALYQAGYEVGRFISLERLISDSRETYYEVLAASGRGWHDGTHDITPWLNYFLGIVTGAYNDFESRVGVVAGRGSKRAAITQFIRASLSDEFTVADVRDAAPTASASYISKTLATLRDEGIIQPVGAGRGARWKRLRSDF